MNNLTKYLLSKSVIFALNNNPLINLCKRKPVKCYYQSLFKKTEYENKNKIFMVTPVKVRIEFWIHNAHLTDHINFILIFSCFIIIAINFHIWLKISVWKRKQIFIQVQRLMITMFYSNKNKMFQFSWNIINSWFMIMKINLNTINVMKW